MVSHCTIGLILLLFGAVLSYTVYMDRMRESGELYGLHMFFTGSMSGSSGSEIVKQVDMGCY